MGATRALSRLAGALVASTLCSSKVFQTHRGKTVGDISLALMGARLSHLMGGNLPSKESARYGNFVYPDTLSIKNTTAGRERERTTNTCVCPP